MTNAIEIRWRLRQLRHKHRLEPEPRSLSLAEAARGPVIIIGIVSTPDLDHDRMQLLPHACRPLPEPGHVRLLLHHDPTRIVGRVEQLFYDSTVNLRIRARVEDAAACRMPALSPGLRLLDGELVDADGPQFRAILRRAVIDEVSLTDKPANAAALITHRMPSAVTDFHDGAIKAMSLPARSSK
jgi:hypothetical protein